MYMDILAQHPVGHSLPREVPTLAALSALGKVDGGRELRRLCERTQVHLGREFWGLGIQNVAQKGE